MHAQGYIREAFLQWITDAVFGRASFSDKTIVVDDEPFAVSKLLGSLSNCSDQLPSSDAWIVADSPDIVGRRAWHTYKNAVRVVRAWRRQ
jgi:hypothetical protein